MSEYNNHLPVSYTITLPSPPSHSPRKHTTPLCFALLSHLAAAFQLSLSFALALSSCVCVWGWRWQKFMLRTKVKQTQKSKRFAALATPTSAVGGASERALSCNIRASKMPDSNNKNRARERESKSTSETTATTTYCLCVCSCVCKTRTNIVKRVGSWHLNGRHLFSARAWHTHTNRQSVHLC